MQYNSIIVNFTKPTVKKRVILFSRLLYDYHITQRYGNEN